MTKVHTTGQPRRMRVKLADGSEIEGVLGAWDGRQGWVVIDGRKWGPWVAMYGVDDQ